MPHWDFECSACGRRALDAFGPRCDVESARPECCGQPMETLWGPAGRGAAPEVSAFEPYVTTHPSPDGRPIEVKGRADIAAIQRQYGVRLIDDPNLEMRKGKLVRKPPPPGSRMFFDCGRRS